MVTPNPSPVLILYLFKALGVIYLLTLKPSACEAQGRSCGSLNMAHLLPFRLPLISDVEPLNVDPLKCGLLVYLDTFCRFQIISVEYVQSFAPEL